MVLIVLTFLIPNKLHRKSVLHQKEGEETLKRVSSFSRDKSTHLGLFNRKSNTSQWGCAIESHGKAGLHAE